jgi:translocation and assembly module TamA
MWLLGLLLALSTLATAPALGEPAAGDDDVASIEVCSNLILRTDDRLTFSTTERRFLCGDAANPPWASLPENQVRVFLVAFLQARGYFQPTFRRDGKVTVVDVGEKSRIRILRSATTPPELDFTRFWVPGRKPLTPALLDEYQALVRSRIESEGYPCPRVDATANAAEGSMHIEVDSGPRQKIVRIQQEEVLGLRPGTLRRYYPFEEGDWFDGDLLWIANERIKAEDMLSSSYMLSRCGQDGAEVEHRAAAGPPRRMRVGFGVNTETYFIVRSTYRNARVDANASRFDATLTANFFDQRLEASFDWYFLPFPSSLHFKPTVSLERRAEKSSEVRTTVASWHLGAYRDALGHYWRAYVGPNLNLIRTVRGEGPDFARIVELELSGRIMSHDYEFYRGSPRSGHLMDWRYTTAKTATLSTLTVKTLSTVFEQLFNFSSLEPPLVVLGVRGGAYTTYADVDQELPDQYLYHLGGSGDVRGFKRRSIPGIEDGARSAVYGGTEARLVTVIPYGLQPFVFVDAGKVGKSAFAMKRPLFYSPGFGVRWQSPIGALRGSVARGLVADLDPKEELTVGTGITAFVSFGEEF